MRMPIAARQRSPFRFNITPMIDVVFLLIIFFLVASYFIRSEQTRPVTLPEADGGKKHAEDTAAHLTITLERDGQYSVGGQLVSLKHVQEKIRLLSERVMEEKSAAQVRIRADRSARFSEIRLLIEECAKEKIGSIRFAVSDGG